MAKKRKFKVLLISVLTVIFINIAVLAVIFAFLLINSGEYQKQSPQITDPNEVSPYLTHYLMQEIWNGVQNDEPFTLTVDQNGINDVITRDSIIDGGWPYVSEPMTIYPPHVKFEQNRLKLLGKIVYKTFEVYLTVHARPKMTENGQMEIIIDKVQAGKLDVTRMAFFVAKDMTAGLFLMQDNLTAQEQMIYAIIQQKPFEPLFYLNDSAVRITDVNLTDQKLILNFDPQEIEP